MNTIQITRLLTHNKVTKKFFRGVFAIDTIPKTIKKPGMMIINTDKSTQPGKHWIAAFVPASGCAEYFDSYGGTPAHTELKNFLQKQSTCFVYNNKRLQGNFTTVCGQYCCVYLWMRCSKKSMQYFLNLFDNSNYEHNDRHVVAIFNKIFNAKNKNKCTQICTSLKSINTNA